jgi:uncharacterized protein (TIGR03437 family)
MVGDGLGFATSYTAYWLLGQQVAGFVPTTTALQADISRSYNPQAVGGEVNAYVNLISLFFPVSASAFESLSGGDYRIFGQQVLTIGSIQNCAGKTLDQMRQEYFAAVDQVFPDFDGWKPSDWLASNPAAFLNGSDGKFLVVEVRSSNTFDAANNHVLQSDNPVITYNFGLPVQFWLRDRKNGNGVVRQDGTINWEIRDTTNTAVRSGKSATNGWLLIDLTGLFGADSFAACWNDPAQPNADCKVGDPAAPNATTFFISANGPQLALLGEFWKDHIYVVCNDYNFQSFAKSPCTLDAQAGSLPEVENIPGFNGVLPIRLHGSRDPFVVTDGVRSKSLRPSYWALPQSDVASRFVLWTEYGDKLQAVANSADWANDYITPGGIFTLWGNGFTANGPTSAPAYQFPLPTSLDNIQVVVRVNGIDYPARLYYVSANQINFLAPAELPTGTTEAQVRAIINGVATNPIHVWVGVKPAAFYADFTAKRPAALFAVGTKAGQLITEANPARIGDWIQSYWNALGPVQPPIKDGYAASISPTSTVIAPVTVTVGGIQTECWAGAAPGFAGLYQVNFKVPAGLPAGLANVIISVGGVTNTTPIKLAVSP